jgi:imidazoleglycerol phosphate synthase cyclase subunit
VTRPRLIPVLLLKHGLIVRSQWFRIHQVIGNPMSTVERYSSWNVDELVLLDISGEDVHDLRRDDLQQRYGGTTALDVLAEVARASFMPLAFGGRIRTLEDVERRFALGADKVVVNTQALDRPAFVTEIAERFGSQALVVSIDVRGGEVVADGGRRPTGLAPAEWARRVEELGAGELFLNSVDRDGTGAGYDLDLIRSVTSATTIPVIACGGVGRYEHLPPGILEGGASAVAAANIFHFFELSYPHAKQACIDAGIPMRPVRLGSRFFPREPEYPPGDGIRRIEERRAVAAQPLPEHTERRGRVRWCTRCVYPSTSAVPLEFDERGVCTGCLVAEAKAAIPPEEWARRRELLRGILERYRNRDGTNYDCVIPVSGGKDSYFQAHVISREFGLRPLLVTYNGNNWTPAGWRNMVAMKERLGLDHVLVSPSVDVLVKLNRLGFELMGDMNWHAHVGITTAPVRVAAQLRIPLVIWGEHGYLDLGGQFSFDDFPEMSYRDRLEHFARGYEWTYFVGLEGLTEQDLIPWQYPSDRELFELDIRGLYLGNFLHWEANVHGPFVIERYGFETADEPFDRTYRTMSNLDDMHENGVHDYLKWVKFGYGRATDHACKDIRAGLITREQAIELVRRYDHVKPRDLARWLAYVGMTEQEFDRIADTFRDPRVWRRENGQWVKDNLWDEEAEGVAA